MNASKLVTGSLDSQASVAQLSIWHPRPTEMAYDVSVHNTIEEDQGSPSSGWTTEEGGWPSAPGPPHLTGMGAWHMAGSETLSPRSPPSPRSPAGPLQDGETPRSEEDRGPSYHTLLLQAAAAAAP
jgi:hypothetical protein